MFYNIFIAIRENKCLGHSHIYTRVSINSVPLSKPITNHDQTLTPTVINEHGQPQINVQDHTSRHCLWGLTCARYHQSNNVDREKLFF